jgi:hypothetical protein
VVTPEFRRRQSGICLLSGSDSDDCRPKLPCRRPSCYKNRSGRADKNREHDECNISPQAQYEWGILKGKLPLFTAQIKLFSLYFYVKYVMIACGSGGWNNSRPELTQNLEERVTRTAAAIIRGIRWLSIGTLT